MGTVKKLYQDQLVGGSGSPGQEVYPITSTLGVYDQEGHQLEGILDNLKLFTCGTAAATAVKTVASSTFVRINGGSVKIKFTYANSADSPTLAIGSSDAKPIIYNGSAASASNTWGDGDIVEFFYDGTNWVGTKGANVEDISELQKKITDCPFRVGTIDNYGYIKELYIPNNEKIIKSIRISKAINQSSEYRNIIIITYIDNTTSEFDHSYISTEAEAIEEMNNVITDESNTFFILISDKCPSSYNQTLLIDNTIFNNDAIKNLNNSPIIKEYIDNHITQTTLTQVQTDVSEIEEKIDELYDDSHRVVELSGPWNDNKLMASNGAIIDITPSDTGYYNRCSTTDLISCAALIGKNLTLIHGEGRTAIAFYESVSGMITGGYSQFTSAGVENITIPESAKYFRLCVYVASAAALSGAKAATKATVVILSNGIERKMFSPQYFGAMKYALPTDFDYAQLLFFGQSFAQGGSSKVVDTGVIPNCYMYGDTVKDFAANKSFNPLQLKTDTNEPYEFPVVSCANAISKMYRRFGMNVNILASTGGASGTSIQTLLDDYISNQSSMNERIKIAADAENKSVGCFAIVYMQGESDYGGRDDSTPSKDAYKAKLLTMKNTLQGLAMSKFGQDRKPLFFIYQTSGSWVRNYTGINNEELGVSMAQLEFAEENEDVILISPAYQVTTYTDSHPSSNGYRWLGEYYAKAIWQTLYRGFRYQNPKMENVVVDKDRVIVYVSNCVLPLVKNTWTLQRQENLGFSVKADGVAASISTIEISDNAIILNLATSIENANSVKVTYGGVGVGKGNICDSDSWGTWLQYLSDDTDDGYDGTREVAYSPTQEGGGSLVGKDYPMNNFLCIFYKEINP